jgi:hypothetical protein
MKKNLNKIEILVLYIFLFLSFFVFLYLLLKVHLFVDSRVAYYFARSP